MRDGAVAEWLMAAVLKTAGAQALVSSNLTRSATMNSRFTSSRRPSRSSRGRSRLRPRLGWILMQAGVDCEGSIRASEPAGDCRQRPQRRNPVRPRAGRPAPAERAPQGTVPGHGAPSLTVTPAPGLLAAAADRARTTNVGFAAACVAVVTVVLVVGGPALAHPALGPVDDHQLPLIMRRIGNEGLLPVFLSYVFEPGARFRPGYWVGQFTELSVWGLNAFGWYLDRMLLLIATIVAMS